MIILTCFMPAATTHLECSKDILERLNKNTKVKISNLNLYYLGAQGPDIFFFEKLGLGKKLLKIGNFMHNYYIYEVVEYIHNYVKEQEKDLYSYFCGYLTHYALDSTVHPIVNHRARYSNNNDKKELVTHFKIEAFYDKYVLNSKNRNISTFDVHKLLKINKDDTNKLAIMYHKMFIDLFECDISKEEIVADLNLIPKVLGFLKPNSKIKFNFIKAIEKLIFPYPLVSALMLYNDFKDKDYILNNNHEEYFNIYDESLKYNDSFDDLYSEGIKKAISLINDPLNKEYYKLDFEGSLIKDNIKLDLQKD